jgi:uncharacterized protein (TIGR02246 family)
MGGMYRLVLSAVALVAMAHAASAGSIEDVMAADRAFAKLAQEKTVPEAFAAYAAPDAHWFAPGPEPIRGPDAIKARLVKAFAKGGKLEWEPKRGWASVDGTMAVTWGRSVYTSPKDAQGKTVSSTGSYMTVWMKQADGSWKFSHDMGTDDPEPKP